MIEEDRPATHKTPPIDGDQGVTEGLAGPVRVMLVEDHAAFRRAMAFLVGRQPDLEVLAQAESLEEARRHAVSVSVEAAVLDLGLPDGDGVGTRLTCGAKSTCRP